MTDLQPHEYPRRVLLAVTGLSPQVVTETLYALTQEEETRFIPTEVRLITTASGAEHARLNLLSSDPGWFHRLCREYELPPIAFDTEYIHVLRDAGGEPLIDIRSRTDNERAADVISEGVRALTADPDCALHVSLAGGRKTMGYLLGYALSLFGRPQDRLSHVLVSPPFESHPQFYYPSRAERVIHALDRQQLALDCRTARVELADIPFVRLREGLPDRLLEGKACFSEVIEAANRGQAPSRMVVEVGTRSVLADGERIALKPTSFALLLWLAERARDGSPEVNWGLPQAADEFLATLGRVLNPASGEFERIANAIQSRSKARDAKLLRAYFEPLKSRVNSTLCSALGRRRAALYEIQRCGQRGTTRYFVGMPPERIDIQA
jgi:CRISPR-associated protein (TIGR02584 family)